ncbi:hypothetical protein BDA99DRAFT_285829 [Phascolomyces articulosus]|uniref:F-box domain-containing protein n=1 Tax=Phascolomyces articulosus TaxID=60185 RepID=A0AAD5JN55_9FUNG|nr:hypothetical protein BDA99DRAFT_285829 [Phascolomyces articulosus]
MNKNTDAMNQTFTGTLLFNELPFDIVTKIFSGISQRDCLTCMTVCRSWYDQLPQYTQDTVWSKLFISSTTVLPQNNQRWKRCIGKHVKHIDFSSFDKEQELYLFLSQMYELGCDQMESLVYIII